LTLGFGTVCAAPAPGTAIPNQATATAQQGVATMSAASNVVSLTVGAGTVTATYGGTLEANRSIANVTAGTTAYARHVLTNTGTASDTFTLSLADIGGDYAFASLAIYADANDDGQPDNATPIAAPVTLAAGQAFHFVVGYAVPAAAPARGAGHARISATSARATVTPDTDEVMVGGLLADCALVTKFMSRSQGASPAGPITVTLGYQPCNKDRARIVLTDRLPAGMSYVAGSGRWSGAAGLVLTDNVAGDDLQGSGGTRVAYDWNATTPGAVTATIAGVPAGANGAITFDVQVDPGLAIGTLIVNGADGVFYDASNNYGPRVNADPATYTVNARVDLDLVGQRLPTATPGSTVIFTNVLTNRGTATETFDITLANSTFPAGTTLALFKSDGTTPLADTDGNGTPDTGPVAPNASYSIIVRARLPETAAPASYKVTKVARAASAPMRTASADDIVDTVSLKCALVFEPDNQATVGPGQHITYTHYLSNHGNCVETVTAGASYLSDSQSWKASPYLDTPTAGNGSLPGALDPTDAPIAQGWNTTLKPGDSVRVLLDVATPTVAPAKAAKGAKDIAAADVTTVTLTGSGSGNVTVRDTTSENDKDQPAQPANSIRNFTDSTYQVPTLWGVVGSSLWLRADASSCNSVPDVAEQRTVVITGPNGEREELLATETGPNTGVFVMDPLPVRAPPVVAGDRILEGNANDVFDVQMLGCAQRIETVVTLMQPQSVVFDSRTNDPVAGARVTLVGASGSQCSGSAVDLGNAGNPVTTDASGRFAFPALAAGHYCLAVQPPNGYHAPSQVPWTQLPATRNLNVTGPTSGGSYGSVFAVATGGLVVIDVPVDATGQDGLFVQKEASRQVVELGDFIDYTVRVRNSTGNVLDRADVTLTDGLPAGFGYVPGTARRDGTRIADPVGGNGPRLVLAIGHMDRDAAVVITYRVRTGPGAMQGDGTNRVQAMYAAGGVTTTSNVAAAKVRVTGGVFDDRGFILGKVHLDCNANGVQDAGEAGVAGVRVVLEDGTYVITDGEGRFSFYGISNRTHVVKVDRTTLPQGARLVSTSGRNLGDAGSRVVDLKAGELGRADFAITGCDDALLAEVKARAQAAASQDELAALAGAQLTTEARVITDAKAMPASGLVAGAAVTALPGATTLPGAAPGAGFGSVAPLAAPERPSPAPRLAAPAPVAQPERALEALLPEIPDNKLAFVSPKDGATLPYAQATVRVKGLAGTTFQLSVNGEAVSEKRVGKRATLAERQLQAWEYIGIELKPGANTLIVTTVDSFGNARGSETIHVTAPDKLGKVSIELPAGGGVADGKTPARVVVKLTDANGVPVTVRTAVTLEASSGKWQADDLDPAEPGVQQFIENGRGEFLLVPPIEPGSARVVVTSGPFKAEATLDFLPELRNLIATGVIEGVVNVRHLSRDSIAPARASDAFEQEIRQLSRQWGNDTQAGVRAAFYLKGKIKGEYLLTAAYDSDKDTQERLFRDIQPDEFYPVYGDSGVRGFDAQSTSKLYVRIDNKRSYLLWGDFTTDAQSTMRKLTNYSRSLTGVKEHYENDRVSVTAFASRDTTRQVIEELRANGTSGPFQLGTQGALVNSEKVEIITRDRNQPAIIVQSVPQARFSDYEIEVLTGRILFKAPVASFDANLNPVFIRVTYEVDQGGDAFWVVGVDGQVKVTDRVQVGAVYVKDKNPLLPFTLGGANLAVKVGESTFVIGEAARTESGLDDTKGNAGRIEIKHESTNLKANAYVAKTDVGFNNPGSYLSQGRGESGGKLDYQLTEKARIHAEALRTEDEATHAVRDGATLAVHYQIAKRLSFEIGMRHAAEKGDTLLSPVPPVAGQPLPEPMPSEVTTVRARVDAGVPGVENAALYGEAEVDIHDADKKILAVGGEYTLPNKGRIYGRHEFISSITGPYGLNPNERQNTTAVGIDTEYMKDGRMFSEYRIRDAMSGGDVEAALGLRNLWSIAPGLKLGTTFERVHALAGTGQDESTAVALALEYTGSDRWKGSTRLEVRNGSTQDSLLFTVGLAARLNKDWTALARNAYNLTRTEGAGDHVIERMQAGLAWRDTETNRWNMLARVEHRMEHDDSTPGVDLRTSTQILSIHADWQPRRPFLVSGRYAAKWSGDTSNGLSTRYHAQVVGARATWEFLPKWDVGVVTSVLMGEGTTSKQYGIGFEVGYLVAQNLWVSAGYNVTGYRDADMAGADYTAKGPYVRLRYKFDEDTLAPVAKKVGAQ
jgi:uncharacterized repeat protein (TIGR01451 family)